MVNQSQWKVLLVKSKSIKSPPKHINLQFNSCKQCIFEVSLRKRLKVVQFALINKEIKSYCLQCTAVYPWTAILSHHWVFQSGDDSFTIANDAQALLLKNLTLWFASFDCLLYECSFDLIELVDLVCMIGCIWPFWSTNVFTQGKEATRWYKLQNWPHCLALPHRIALHCIGFSS